MLHEDLDSLHHLTTLSENDVVGQLGSDGSQSTWQFTHSGLQRVQPFRPAVAPERVLEVRANVALQDRTNWELLAMLVDDGWDMHPAPKFTKSFQALPPYVEGGVRIWYNRCVDVSRVRPYMSSLLRADELFRSGCLVALHHGQPPKYYKDVMSGSSDGVVRVVPAIVDGGLEPDGGQLQICSKRRVVGDGVARVVGGGVDGDIDLPGTGDEVGDFTPNTRRSFGWVRATRWPWGRSVVPPHLFRGPGERFQHIPLSRVVVKTACNIWGGACAMDFESNRCQSHWATHPFQGGFGTGSMHKPSNKQPPCVAPSFSETSTFEGVRVR